MYNLTNTIKERNRAIRDDIIFVILALVIAWFTFKEPILMVWDILTHYKTL